MLGHKKTPRCSHTLQLFSLLPLSFYRKHTHIHVACPATISTFTGVLARLSLSPPMFLMTSRLSAFSWAQFSDFSDVFPYLYQTGIDATEISTLFSLFKYCKQCRIPMIPSINPLSASPESTPGKKKQFLSRHLLHNLTFLMETLVSTSILSKLACWQNCIWQQSFREEEIL